MLDRPYWEKTVSSIAPRQRHSEPSEHLYLLQPGQASKMTDAFITLEVMEAHTREPWGLVGRVGGVHLDVTITYHFLGMLHLGNVLSFCS